MALEGFQEQKTFSRIIYSIPVILTAVALVLALIFGAWKAYFAKRIVDKETASLKKNIEEALGAREKAEQKLAKLNTPEGLERGAREMFNLKKTDEEIVIFLDEDSHSRAGDRSSAASILNAVKNFFLKIF